MNQPPDERRQALTESPWYWVYLFATAALIALIIMGPRFANRQAQIESEGIKRQRAAMLVRGKQVPETEEEEAPGTIISLRPLYVLLAGILATAWTVLWLSHFRQKHPSISNEPPDKGTP